MTAPQHTTEPKAGKKDSESSTATALPTTLQRCWFVTLGLLGGLGFVASHVSFARAESVEIADVQLQAIPQAAVNSSTAAKASPEAAPAYVPTSVTVPTSAAAPSAATTVAPPTFTSVKKPVATKSARRSPLAGLVEAGALAGPLSAYVSGAQASEASHRMAGRTAETRVASSTLATNDPTTKATAPESAPSASPDSHPEGSAAAPPIVDITPAAAPVAPIQPTELVPAALPEGTNLPKEYNSVFVDPTNYSVGATQSPDVVVSEQSTGCKFTVSSGRAVPDGACGSARAHVAAPGSHTPAPPVAHSYSSPAPVASRSPAVNVGPVSFSTSGIRFNSTTAAGREYLNRSVSPLVNLQAAQQFIFPLAIPAPITSLFGFRIHPITGERRFHAGTDLGAAEGTPVLAAQAGTVVSAGYAGGYGMMVVLDHKVDGNELQSRYAHLSEILVEPGKSVRKGEVVGLVGSTGLSTGPHLHFEMAQNTANGWVLVNPDGLIQDSLIKLVKALNSPMQAMNFNLSDFNLNLTAMKTPADRASASVTPPSLPGQNGVPFRPAQPNAS